jgi:tRNA U54 and U55 pseudouridine synthase Pus10
MKLDTSKVNRLEVINHTSKGEFGRAFTYWSEYDNGIEQPKIELSFQDEGKTLKIIISPADLIR